MENIVVLTVLPLQGEVPAEQAEGAPGLEVVRMDGDGSTGRVPEPLKVENIGVLTVLRLMSLEGGGHCGGGCQSRRRAPSVGFAATSP